MLHDKRVLAIIPARGGSKELPSKNIRPMAGIPLIAWVGKVIARLPWLDRAVVSTDYDDIAIIAEAAGMATPFRRPTTLAGDMVPDWDVLDHALRIMEALDHVRYDVILMLQPTCPLRKPIHVESTALKLITGGFDAVWTVSKTDSKSHPLKQLTVIEGKLDYYDSAASKIITRQQLTSIYHRNGAAYAITRECLLNKHSIKGDTTGAVIIKDPLVSVDTQFDLDYCEFMLNKYYTGQLFD